jgi:tetratricopeptide (TPR) repeat protein
VRYTLIFTILILTCAHALASPTQELDHGRSSFKHGDFQSAIPVLNSLLHPHVQLGERDEAVEAFTLLGAAFFEIGNKERAVEEFTQALDLDPERSITTLTFSEGAVHLFDRTKEDVQLRLQHDAEKKQIAERLEKLEAYRKSLHVYTAHPFYLNFMPFGLAQFTQNRNGMGTLQLIGQGSTFVASVGIFGYLVGTYGFVSNAVPITSGPAVRRLQQIEIGTGIAFFGFYAWSVYDAIRHHKARQQVQGDDSLIPKELLDPTPTKPGKTSLLERLQIGPMITPTGAGIGIGWEN